MEQSCLQEEQTQISPATPDWVSKCIFHPDSYLLRPQPEMASSKTHVCVQLIWMIAWQSEIRSTWLDTAREIEQFHFSIARQENWELSLHSFFNKEYR